MRITSTNWLLGLAGSCLVFACSSNNSDQKPGNSLSGGTGATAGSGVGSAGIVGIGSAGSAGLVTTGDLVVSQAGCGDGALTKNEACDDRNTDAGDGCSADCKRVEPGFSCIPFGQPCHRIARCGDGAAVLPELCDDGNKVSGDGCSETCKVELGYKCEVPGTPCTETKCGDGQVEGAEGCEDGNALPFDGCSSDCQKEPNCKGPSCVSECGDGLLIGEDCDDGNTADGDGCSSKCTVEPGFDCVQPPLGDKMTVPAVYRDFRTTHKDFEPSTPERAIALTGIVKPELDAEGKPVYTGNVTGSGIGSVASFAQWYRNVPGTNSTTAGKMNLWDNKKGGYVNRWKEDGTQWAQTRTVYFCGTVGLEIDGKPCTFKNNPTDCDKETTPYLECFIDGTTYKAKYLLQAFDGSPLFFPVDNDPFTPTAERSDASVPPPFGNWEKDPGHNFHFTSEVRYWFKYSAGKTYTLDFSGDDDVWVFINRKLAVDIGGIHSPASDSVVLDATSAAKFGVEDGKVYEMVVFQAERHTTASTYKLTLSGFTAAPSDCRPKCGDNIVGIGEECDDGTNDGGYGECSAGCKLGEFCGDGVLQSEFEDCDDGNNIDGDGCGSACRTLVLQ